MNAAVRASIAALTAALVIACPIAAAEPFFGFSGPPETWPGAEWQTPFPYPRNIYWDFAEDPRGGPSPEGSPGAHYEGWDDPVIRISDYVEFTGDFQWYDHVQGDEFHESFGVIGIDNRGGTSTLTGSAVFHIDNSDMPWVKHVAITTLYGYPYDGGPDHPGEVSIGVNPPPGYVVTPTFNQAAALATMYWLEHSSAFTVVPNPPWEEIVLTATVDPGEELYFDHLHIATECIPEPPGLGAVALALLALKRQRR